MNKKFIRPDLILYFNRFGCKSCQGRENKKSYYINLDINQIKEMAEKSKISFEKSFSETVSHEYIHYLLIKYMGEKISIQFDNLGMKKAIWKYKKHVKHLNCFIDEQYSYLMDFFEGGFCK